MLREIKNQQTQNIVFFERLSLRLCARSFLARFGGFGNRIPADHLSAHLRQLTTSRCMYSHFLEMTSVLCARVFRARIVVACLIHSSYMLSGALARSCTWTLMHEPVGVMCRCRRSLYKILEDILE